MMKRMTGEVWVNIAIRHQSDRPGELSFLRVKAKTRPKETGQQLLNEVVVEPQTAGLAGCGRGNPVGLSKKSKGKKGRMSFWPPGTVTFLESGPPRIANGNGFGLLSSKQDFDTKANGSRGIAPAWSLIQEVNKRSNR
jgi:hypothetical protein